MGGGAQRLKSARVNVRSFDYGTRCKDKLVGEKRTPAFRTSLIVVARFQASFQDATDR